MNNEPFAFTYQDSSGAEGAIVLESMRKLWVDHDRSGIIFAEPTGDGSEFLHEVVIEGPEGCRWHGRDYGDAAWDPVIRTSRATVAR